MISGKVCRHISASGYQETMINWYTKPQKCIAIKIISMVPIVDVLVVNMVMDLIIIIWGLDEVLRWCKTNFIMRRGYHGGGFDGNNSKKVLDRLESLEEQVPLSCLPLVDLLRSFRPIVSGCFGSTLDPEYPRLFREFKDSFLKAQEHIQNVDADVSLRVSWKLHIAMIHMPQFFDRTGQSMSRFSEQTGEAVHHKMREIMARFRVDEDNPKHGERLKRAVVEFSTERL